MAYSPTLGRWMEQDPAGYVDGEDLYQMEDSRPLTEVDPLGLDGYLPGGGTLSPWQDEFGFYRTPPVVPPPPGQPIPAAPPSHPKVYLCQRIVHLPAADVLASSGKYHQWIVIVFPDGTRVARGLGNGNGVPGANGQQSPDLPGSPTYVRDHSNEPTDHATEIEGIDIDKLSKEIQLNRYMGLFLPGENDCNTFAKRTLDNSKTSNTMTEEERNYWIYMWHGLVMPM